MCNKVLNHMRIIYITTITKQRVLYVKHNNECAYKQWNEVFLILKCIIVVVEYTCYEHSPLSNSRSTPLIAAQLLYGLSYSNRPNTVTVHSLLTHISTHDPAVVFIHKIDQKHAILLTLVFSLTAL